MFFLCNLSIKVRFLGKKSVIEAHAEIFMYVIITSKMYNLSLIMKPVIFDMDGVLIDTEPLNDQHMVEFLKRLGVDASAK